MNDYQRHIISGEAKIKEALIKLDQLASDAILFAVDDQERLLGSLTDGDIRRGLIKNLTTDDKVIEFCQNNPKFILKGQEKLDEIQYFRENNFKIIPVINEAKQIIKVLNFRTLRSYLPLDAMIMAGGRGSRLQPLTDTIPKPLLKVGDLPIMEHNLNRLALYGIDDFHVSVKYLGEQIIEHFKDGKDKGVEIDYVTETKALGTIGSMGLVESYKHDYVLLTNSDILTNLDYEQFFQDFLEKDADLSIVSIPYEVDIPYAVLEEENGVIKRFKEKPTYTYYSNGGIYLMKKSCINTIPKDEFFDATDFMQKLIDQGKKVISYPLVGYWLDVGKHADFEKAQRDIQKIKF